MEEGREMIKIKAWAVMDDWNDIEQHRDQYEIYTEQDVAQERVNYRPIIRSVTIIVEDKT